jgi:hypothetical protein
MNKHIKQVLFFFLISSSVFAQIEQEVLPPDFIKTITFKGRTIENQFPILKLGERLVLEFDAINGDEEDFYYTIEHYNFDWTPSVLIKNEYIDGLDNQWIREYENSFNTYQIYSHYKLMIPNDQTRRIKKTGNYMIKIYDDYDELIFSRKFMVYQNKANVGIAIKRSRDVKYITQKQSVDFKISSSSMLFTNPKNTVKTVVIQNNNLNSAITNLKPLYTIGNELIYKFNTDVASFWAGNEFLYFENKDIRGSNTGIQFIELKDLYHNYLYTDIVRANRSYTYNPDINGSFVVTALDAEKPSIEADYAWLHFSLLYPKLFDDSTIHIYGSFNNYAITDDTKMTYNTKTGYYESIQLFKQGFYNYKYVIVDKDGNINEGEISGNFDQTENSYKVLVYYRDLGARYDEIIGFGETDSVNISN